MTPARLRLDLKQIARASYKRFNGHYVIVHDLKKQSWTERRRKLPQEKQGIVVEVRFSMERPGASLSDFGAPIWISVGRTGDVEGFLSNIAVWPIWDHQGGLAPQEADELRSVLQLGRRAQMGAALVIRPTAVDGDAQFEGDDSVLALSLGTQGGPLHRGIDRMSEFFSSLIIGGTKQ